MYRLLVYALFAQSPSNRLLKDFRGTWRCQILGGANHQRLSENRRRYIELKEKVTRGGSGRGSAMPNKIQAPACRRVPPENNLSERWNINLQVRADLPNQLSSQYSTRSRPRYRSAETSLIIDRYRPFSRHIEMYNNYGLRGTAKQEGVESSPLVCDDDGT
ncbi:hypothetical protein SCHPADRAFT_897167 [Schizopora paradoxa]|uniref:Uncharacterized protein n=1 Tax=Schizopora paradoxa TaxID=27342 RepID=A0A0H2QXC7_9AGAM|nr:hypothetical protein SCHPADRAFT_897167 [Schizopora paradoxa]